MSNYSFRTLPAGLADHFAIGAETINGTGQVQVMAYDGDPQDNNTTFVVAFLDIEDAKELAEAIYHAACDAEWAKRTERCWGDQPPRGQAIEAEPRHNPLNGRINDDLDAIRTDAPGEVSGKG